MERGTVSSRIIAPGSVVLHPDRGWGVITSVNLLTGWVGARFNGEARATDINLCSDDLWDDDGVPISFRRAPPDRMPHARLMAMVRALHQAGYQRLYLYTWPKPSGLHWRWHLFCGERNWAQRYLREGWYGSGADYNLNPVFGWGDQPGASVEELIHSLARFDPSGLAMALGRDEDHTRWFAEVCDRLLPNYAFSLGWSTQGSASACSGQHILAMPESVPVIPVRRNGSEYRDEPIPWPPGWQGMWRFAQLRLPQTQRCQGSSNRPLIFPDGL